MLVTTQHKALPMLGEDCDKLKGEACFVKVYNLMAGTVRSDIQNRMAEALMNQNSHRL